MYITMIVLAGALGVFTAFIGSVFSSMSLDTYNSILELKSKSFKRLQNLRADFEDTINAFFILEIFFYTVSFMFCVKYIYDTFGSWIIAVYSILILFPVMIILRIGLYALGRRYADTVVIPIFPVFSFSAWFISPYLKIMNYLNVKSNINHEEATREELNEMVETAREEGSIEPNEYRILKNIMNFSDVIVSDVMTPRTVVFSCEAEKTVGDVLNLPELKMYSRFPVWEGESLDAGVIGYVMSKEVYHAALSGNTGQKLRELSREIYFIPENAELDVALDSFIKRRQHLFAVVDEYGGVEGLLTMEDVLETMLGVEIVDEADKVVDLRVVAKHLRDRRIAGLSSKSNTNN